MKQRLWPCVLGRWWAAPPHWGELKHLWLPLIHPCSKRLSFPFSLISITPLSPGHFQLHPSLFSTTLEPVLLPQGPEAEAVRCHIFKGHGASSALDTEELKYKLFLFPGKSFCSYRYVNYAAFLVNPQLQELSEVSPNMNFLPWKAVVGSNSSDYLVPKVPILWEGRTRQWVAWRQLQIRLLLGKAYTLALSV